VGNKISTPSGNKMTPSGNALGNTGVTVPVTPGNKMWPVVGNKREPIGLTLYPRAAESGTK